MARLRITSNKGHNYSVAFGDQDKTNTHLQVTCTCCVAAPTAGPLALRGADNYNTRPHLQYIYVVLKNYTYGEIYSFGISNSY
jgi:hypothetical protein